MVDMHGNSYYSIYHMADMSDYSIYLSNLAANSPTDITLTSARAYARDFQWSEIKHNATSGFVAFQKYHCSDTYIRLVVFYKTGTLLSEMDHPDKGPTKLFRMHVDSQLMGELFKNPRKHSNLGYYSLGGKLRRLEEQSWNYPSENFTLEYFIRNINEEILKLSKLKTALIAKTDAGKKDKEKVADVVDEIEPIGFGIANGGKFAPRKRSEEVGRKSCKGTEKQVEGLTCGDKRLILEMARDDEESGRRGQMLEEIEARSEKSSSSSSSSEDEEDTEAKLLKHGNTLGYSISKDLHKFLDGINLRQSTCILALPSGGMLYNKLEKTYWTRAIFNVDIYKLLNNDSQCPSWLRTIAIGSMDRYYISMAHGVSYWYGPKSMDTLLRDSDDSNRNSNRGYVDSVAFGREFNSYVIMYKNGPIVYCNIPKKLEIYILKYTKSKKRWPNFISMGPASQFFIRFTDETWKCGGMDEKDEKYLHSIAGRVREVSFADKGIVVRYNDISAD